MISLTLFIILLNCIQINAFEVYILGWLKNPLQTHSSNKMQWTDFFELFFFSWKSISKIIVMQWDLLTSLDETRRQQASSGYSFQARWTHSEKKNETCLEDMQQSWTLELRMLHTRLFKKCNFLTTLSPNHCLQSRPYFLINKLISTILSNVILL